MLSDREQVLHKCEFTCPRASLRQPLATFSLKLLGWGGQARSSVWITKHSSDHNVVRNQCMWNQHSECVTHPLVKLPYSGHCHFLLECLPSKQMGHLFLTRMRNFCFLLKSLIILVSSLKTIPPRVQPTYTKRKKQLFYHCIYLKYWLKSERVSHGLFSAAMTVTTVNIWILSGFFLCLQSHNVACSATY